MSTESDKKHGEEMHQQQFVRNRAFFGDAGQQHIENAYVVVVGLGGVGSHAASMLARSGIGKLRLIDFDVVTVSSLNRHAVATRNDIGKSKSEVMRDHILSFNPDIVVEAVVSKFNSTNAHSLIGTTPPPQFVVDCIDDVETKADLLEYCLSSGIPAISSMGSGCRSNTTSIIITNITDVKYDPLASKIRQILRKRGYVLGSDERATKSEGPHQKSLNDIPTTTLDSMREQVMNESGLFIACVSSYEKPVMNLLSMDESKLSHTTDQKLVKVSDQVTECSEKSETPKETHSRTRCIPVYGCVPAVFGNTICSYILHSISQRSFMPQATVPVSQEVVLKLFNRLQTKELKRFNNAELPIDYYDLQFLIQQIFKQKCVFTHKSICGNKLEFCRWNAFLPPTVDNLVLGTMSEVEKHERMGIERLDEETRNRIEKLIKSEAISEMRNQVYY